MNIALFLRNEEDTLELGRALAAALSQNSAVRALYLYGNLGSGKTTLSRGLVSALPGGEQAEVASPSFTLCNEYPTQPRVLHADLYRLGPGASLPEEITDEMEDSSPPLLLLEWTEYLNPEEYTENRLEIRLDGGQASCPLQGPGTKFLAAGGLPTQSPLQKRLQLDISGQSCERKRLAGITGHGEAGKALLQSLRPHLEPRFGASSASPAQTVLSTLPADKDGE